MLGELYEKHGYFLNTLYSFEFEGPKGQDKMKNIMEKFRNLGGELCGQKIASERDYLKKTDDLPKSDVLKFILETGNSIVVRPSGTEPKIKIYLSVSGDNRAQAEVIEKELSKRLKDMVEESYLLDFLDNTVFAVVFSVIKHLISRIYYLLVFTEIIAAPSDCNIVFSHGAHQDFRQVF